jgi:hypothetical protein
MSPLFRTELLGHDYLAMGARFIAYPCMRMLT